MIAGCPPRRNHFPHAAKPAGNKPGLASHHWTKGDSVMWDFINELYRDFCLARLQEMRKLEQHI